MISDDDEIIEAFTRIVRNGYSSGMSFQLELSLLARQYSMTIHGIWRLVFQYRLKECLRLRRKSDIQYRELYNKYIVLCRSRIRTLNRLIRVKQGYIK